ncbi:hypothetical protein OMAG_002290 [Candidatus Omnitrophus magneticus]|uniref:Uncharacterized protein n=1 Tax=Candidatus Omnitrophus magneticus TaxID=1609969 RepID=A0A0F0CPA6_9BACT|nr:hypothetical protein OMAG_002290 [Candidatus Omnitrophus magneticus]
MCSKIRGIIGIFIQIYKGEIKEGEMVMRKFFMLVCFLIVATAIVLTGCGAKKAESSQAAIKQAETMATVEEKTNYLVGQAKAFYNSKDLQEAVNIAQYVIIKLNADSSAAKDILAKAQADLTKEMQKSAEELKKTFSSLGKK